MSDAAAAMSAGEPWPLSSVWSLRPKEAKVCPIRVSLGVLGRKWTLVVLRDIAFRPDATFSLMMARTAGLTPRVLSLRLKELRAEGLIEKVADPTDERKSHYRLTSKGRDAVPILTALVAFGIRHRAEAVFEDGRPRSLEECFPGRAPELMGDLYEYAVRSQEIRSPADPSAGGPTRGRSARETPVDRRITSGRRSARPSAGSPRSP